MPNGRIYISIARRPRVAMVRAFCPYLELGSQDTPVEKKNCLISKILLDMRDRDCPSDPRPTSSDARIVYIVCINQTLVPMPRVERCTH